MTKKEINAYLKRSDLAIEGNVATWTLGMEGSILGTYAGIFKFKCYLTPSEQLAAGRLYRELLGPNAALAFSAEDNAAYMLSQLKYRVVSAPPFWHSSVGVDGIAGDVPDQAVLEAILEAAVASQFKYMALLQQRKYEMLKKAKAAAEKALAKKDGDAPEEENEG